MNTIDRFEQQYDSSEKSFKGKIMSGARERATKEYFKDAAARARRKQGKQNYDTFRRDEQPDAEDLRLEDIHFANFLGLKDTVYGVPYNNVHINEPVNICECDILRPWLEEDKASETASEDEAHRIIVRHDNLAAMVAYMRQQVELAQQMVDNGELYNWDCDK